MTEAEVKKNLVALSSAKKKLLDAQKVLQDSKFSTLAISLANVIKNTSGWEDVYKRRLEEKDFEY